MKKFAKATVVWLGLLSGACLAAEEQQPDHAERCKKFVESTAGAACKKPQDQAILGKMQETCSGFTKDLAALHKRYADKKTACLKKEAERQALVKKIGTGAQAKANAEQEKALEAVAGGLKECATEVEAIAAEMAKMGEQAEEFKQKLDPELSKLTPACRQAVDKIFEAFKTSAVKHAEVVDKGGKELKAAAEKAQELKDGNKATAEKGKGGEPPAGSGGGGMPTPQIPKSEKKKDDAKEKEKEAKYQACLAAQRSFEQQLNENCNFKSYYLCHPDRKDGCDKKCSECVENCRNKIAATSPYTAQGAAIKPVCHLIKGLPSAK